MRRLVRPRRGAREGASRCATPASARRQRRRAAVTSYPRRQGLAELTRAHQDRRRGVPLARPNIASRASNNHYRARHIARCCLLGSRPSRRLSGAGASGQIGGGLRWPAARDRFRRSAPRLPLANLACASGLKFSQRDSRLAPTSSGSGAASLSLATAVSAAAAPSGRCRCKGE